MKTRYERTTFVEDESGKRYVCVFDDDEEHTHDYEKLDEDEKSHCKSIEFPWN